MVRVATEIESVRSAELDEMAERLVAWLRRHHGAASIANESDRWAMAMQYLATRRQARRDLPASRHAQGTTRQVLCAKGSLCSPGAPTAPSAASLPWTARANPGTLSSSTGPRECVLVGGRERARA